MVTNNPNQLVTKAPLPAANNSPAQTIQTTEPASNAKTSQSQSNTNLTVEYAGFLTRFIAAIIDGIILTIAMGPIFFILIVSSGALSREPGADPPGILSFLFYPIMLIILVLYWIVLQHKIGQTLGKKIMKIKVVDSEGSNASIKDLAMREILGKFVSGIIPLYIGHIMVIFTARKQALHDKIAGTYVIKVK